MIGDIEKHFWLTRSVARVMGINLTEAIHAGRITEIEYADMVTRCRYCSRVSTCEGWLSQAQSLTNSAPPDCANATQLRALSRPN